MRRTVLAVAFGICAFVPPRVAGMRVEANVPSALPLSAVPAIYSGLYEELPRMVEPLGLVARQLIGLPGVNDPAKMQAQIAALPEGITLGGLNEHIDFLEKGNTPRWEIEPLRVLSRQAYRVVELHSDEDAPLSGRLQKQVQRVHALARELVHLWKAGGVSQEETVDAAARSGELIRNIQFLDPSKTAFVEDVFAADDYVQNEARRPSAPREQIRAPSEDRLNELPLPHRSHSIFNSRDPEQRSDALKQILRTKRRFQVVSADKDFAWLKNMELAHPDGQRMTLNIQDLIEKGELIFKDSEGRSHDLLSGWTLESRAMRLIPPDRQAASSEWTYVLSQIDSARHIDRGIRIRFGRPVRAFKLRIDFWDSAENLWVQKLELEDVRSTQSAEEKILAVPMMLEARGVEASEIQDGDRLLRPDGSEGPTTFRDFISRPNFQFKSSKDGRRRWFWNKKRPFMVEGEHTPDELVYRTLPDYGVDNDYLEIRIRRRAGLDRTAIVRYWDSMEEDWFGVTLAASPTEK